MDEPSLGLSPTMIDECFQIVARIRDNGKAVLLIEQNAETALSIAERGYLLIRGQIAVSGSSVELLKDDTIRHLSLYGAARDLTRPRDQGCGGQGHAVAAECFTLRSTAPSRNPSGFRLGVCSVHASPPATLVPPQVCEENRGRPAPDCLQAAGAICGRGAVRRDLAI